MADKDCKDICFDTGLGFKRMVGDNPTTFPINVAGLAREHDLVVPHSELAMHVGAAGKQLLAWSLIEKGSYAVVAYEDGNGCCSYTHGLPTEVMTPGLVDLTKKMLGIKES